MSVNDLILVILVGAGAFYAGYQLGRFKALSERGARPDDQPLPGPRDRPYSEPTSPRTGDESWTEASRAPEGRAPVRRSTKPPPAAAGLMDTGGPDKPAKG